MSHRFEPNNRVQWFSGEWFEEGASERGRDKALLVLRDTLMVCINRDTRQDEMMLAAVDYLKRQHTADKPWLADNFRKALDQQSPELRFIEAKKAYTLLARGCRSDVSKSAKY